MGAYYVPGTALKFGVGGCRGRPLFLSPGSSLIFAGRWRGWEDGSWIPLKVWWRLSSFSVRKCIHTHPLSGQLLDREQYIHLLLSLRNWIYCQHCLWIIYLDTNLSQEACIITPISSQGNWGAERWVNTLAPGSSVSRKWPQAPAQALCPTGQCWPGDLPGPREADHHCPLWAKGRARLRKVDQVATWQFILTCWKIILIC